MIAKLDPETELNAERSAQAALTAAQGQLNYARNDFDRQQQLLANGHTTRARFDQAQKALQNAQAAVANATAQLQIAKDRVGYTTLEADGAGTVTARGAEPGEVVPRAAGLLAALKLIAIWLLVLLAGAVVTQLIAAAARSDRQPG